MSYATTLLSHATFAQRLLAEIAGADVASPNALYNGLDLIGVFGGAQTYDVPTAAGGYRRRTQLRFSATREQFAAAPVTKKLLVHIDLNDPFFYHFTLVKNGD